ncbi:MAG: SCP2 sterol-binding domain-containing protein [Thermocladium sp.]
MSSEDPIQLLNNLVEANKGKIMEKMKNVNKVYQFQGTNLEAFYVQIKDGAVTIIKGTHPSPNLAVSISRDNLVKLIKGELDPISAFFKGLLMITKGNPMEAMDLVNMKQWI